MTRVCRDCGEAKPTTEFRGQRPACKTCEAAYSKRRKERPDVKAKDRKNKARMYELRGADIRAKNNKWRSEHRDLVRGFNARDYRLNAVARKTEAAAWDHANRDKRRAINANKRAIKAGAYVEYVDRMIVYTRDHGLCGICEGLLAPTNFHVDHVIPLSLGGLHCYANVQAAHPACNISKKNKLPA